MTYIELYLHQPKKINYNIGGHYYTIYHKSKLPIWKVSWVLSRTSETDEKIPIAHPPDMYSDICYRELAHIMVEESLQCSGHFRSSKLNSQAPAAASVHVQNVFSEGSLSSAIKDSQLIDQAHPDYLGESFLLKDN